MSIISELQDRFSIPGVATIEAGQKGLPRVVVTTPDADAHVYLYGAHVTHYRPRGGKPVLFMSAKSRFEAGRPIRGGVPVIFPWFGPFPADPVHGPAHGFARTQAWALHYITQNADGVTVALTLGPSEGARERWPHDFELNYLVTVGSSLRLQLEVRNAGATPFTFEEALHTYLAVGDVREVTVKGLAGRNFIDKIDHMKRKTEGQAPIQIQAETDRIYLNTPDTVTIDDVRNRRTISVSKEGSGATVVWNPWIAKARTMSDFGDDEWPGMLCVETANTADHAVTLKPGATHMTRATIKVT